MCVIWEGRGRGEEAGSGEGGAGREEGPGKPVIPASWETQKDHQFNVSLGKLRESATPGLSCTPRLTTHGLQRSESHRTTGCRLPGLPTKPTFKHLRGMKL